MPKTNSFRVVTRRSKPPTSIANAKIVDNPIEFLAESGLLGHINVKILHPLGYALSATNDPITGKLTLGHLEQATENPVFVLPPDAFDSYKMKFSAFLQERGNKTMELRESLLKFVVQKKG